MKDKSTKTKNGMNWTLVILLISGAFVVGIFYNRMQGLEKQVAELSSGNTKTTGTTVGNNNPTTNTGSAAAAQPPTTQSADEVDPVTDEDHVKGNRNARIMLIEYSDTECPFCKRFHPTAQQVVDSYDGQVAWVYRHFPLVQLHRKAPKEAEALECAGELGGNDGFWAYTDKLFEVTPSNDGLQETQLPEIASQVGLNVSQFQTCLDSGKYAQHVQEDFDSGTRAGVTGTPGNIILDTQTGKTTLLPGAYPFEQVKAAIDAMLQS